MFRIGRRHRHLSNAVGHLSRPTATAQKQDGVSGIVKAVRARRGFVENPDGTTQSVSMQEDLLAESKTMKGGAYKEGPVVKDGKGNVVSALSSSTGGSSGGSGGSTGFGGNNAKVDRFNPVYDDLSRGTVAEDWIPRDPRLQNRMFRMMFARGAIEGPVVETISELCWSDFDIVGIRDKKILDTYNAAKDAVRVDRYLEDITREYLVIGRAIVQMVLDPAKGIWTDMIIHDSDYVQVAPVFRSGFMPKLDLLPSPELQRWAKSIDPRDMDARKGLPKQLIDQFAQNKPIPLDPTVTAYMPRRSFFNDVQGTSFFVRNIPFWGLEKSLINATLTGHRRRAGPITQISVGSEQWEPTPEQIDALVSAYTAAEEDSVSSTIGTRYDVAFNQIRGGLQEMWKWSDDWAFLQEAKLKMFGVSEQLITGEGNLDTNTAPTIFLERLKAHRRYIVETFLQQKFFRALAQVHQFRKRSQAELDHRVRVENDDHDLILPTLSFHRNLDVAADTARADLLDKLEKGLPVGSAEWNRTLGGGELSERMRGAVEDLHFKLDMMKFQAMKTKVNGMLENADGVSDADIAAAQKEVSALKFARDNDGYDIAALSTRGKKRAEEMTEGLNDDGSGGVADEPAPGGTTSSSVFVPRDTISKGTPEEDLSRDRTNRDPATLNSPGKAV